MNVKETDSFATISHRFHELATSLDLDVHSSNFAAYLDQHDALSFLRQEFFLPPNTSTHLKTPTSQLKNKNENEPELEVIEELLEEEELDKVEPMVYLCGNSLGLQPKATKKAIEQVLTVWSQKGVLGHVESKRPWVTYDEPIAEKIAELIGALPMEVALMGSLTSNLHFLMIPFYRPTEVRYKIVIEELAFPSDRFAVCSQIAFHGYNPEEALIELKPRPNEYCLHLEDIEQVLHHHGETIALILLPGVQYFTGEVFPIQHITHVGHQLGCKVGWDLAHAIGNIDLKLHAWQVDFAVWCSYKYLNAGPGSLAGLFVHERHAVTSLPRFTGWWGNRLDTRFSMQKELHLTPGAPGFRQSNPSILALTGLLGSMEVFNLVPFSQLRAKSNLLTSYMLMRLMPLTFHFDLRILTPKEPHQRGCQVSICIPNKATLIVTRLRELGIIVDKREPNVLRVSPTPLYNTFMECWKFVNALERVLQSFSSLV